jgi:hypothetical protein
MKGFNRVSALTLVLIWVTVTASAQVYSPKVLAKGQMDASDLVEMAKGIYAQAGAVTPRQKAEAIWRFFLTDGRFVAPGFWYHIAGWTYEEPQGEVLDPLKLLNSYGFGLCYHIAPLLQAVYRAGGFEDARVWFLTGHTVTEVFYQGAYHYFDSDMMGYTPVGAGDPKALPVASVSQIARNSIIILSKLKSPTQVDATKVDYPWYPADLREAAMGDLAALFTSTKDNWLYGFTRYPQSHSMEFVLRPGERLIRYFKPEFQNLYHLPFSYDGKDWREFPRESAQYKIRTEDGPKSQKDNRYWSTGCLEYTPLLWDRTAYYPVFGPGFNLNLQLPDPRIGRDFLSRNQANQVAQAVFEMRCPYVLLDAKISIEALLQTEQLSLQTELSCDGGKSWEVMGSMKGPFRGVWRSEPGIKMWSLHGNRTAITGQYGYLVRLKMEGAGPAQAVWVKDIQISSRFQLNPRTLPELVPGINELVYRPGAPLRRDVLSVEIDQLPHSALRASAVRSVAENGQWILWPDAGRAAEIVFELSAPDGTALSGFDVGARFLDLRNGLAPDKFTAETRATSLGQESSAAASAPQASIAWSTSLSGGYSSLWDYNPVLQWKDGLPVDQVLRWPEVDRQVRSLPAGTRKVYVRYRLTGMGMDSPRLAVLSPRSGTSEVVEITHEWFSDGQKMEHVERIDNPHLDRAYRVNTGQGKSLTNHAVILYCPPQKSR